MMKVVHQTNFSHYVQAIILLSVCATHRNRMLSGCTMETPINCPIDNLTSSGRNTPLQDRLPPEELIRLERRPLIQKFSASST